MEGTEGEIHIVIMRCKPGVQEIKTKQMENERWSGYG
jgi:hypothetical protein